MSEESCDTPLKDIDVTDHEAVRAWMESHRHCGDDPHRSRPQTPQELALLQRMRLLQSLTSEDEN